MPAKRYASVWDAIEKSPSAAANMKARAELMIALQKAIDGWKVTQLGAAERLGISQPRLNDLMRGRIDRFSLDALVNLASSAGLRVRLHLARRVA